MKSHLVSFMLILIVALVPVVGAQVDCPALVRTALAAADEVCQSTGRNQACYGNVSMSVTPQAGVTDLMFEQTGDIADVAQIASLQLSSLDADSGVWGVALMKLQANLPDTLPGQNVTFLLFGDVAIDNASAPAGPQLEVTSTGNINVRAEPNTNGAVVTTLQKDQTVVAVGRLEDSSWVQIQLPDDENATGWVSAPLLTSTDALDTLAVSDGQAGAQYGPMQSFYFKTGLSDSPCNEAPDSGILIQTPEGAGTVNLVVNGVDIELGSTAYLQAQPSGEMVVNVVEGQAQVEAEGENVTVPAGTRTRVPVDEQLEASGPPTAPEPYDNAELAALPVGNLEHDISIATALTAEEIAALANSLVPVSGTWNGRNTASTCPAFVESGSNEAMTVAEDGSSFEVAGVTYQRTAPGVYEGNMQGVTQAVFTVVSPEFMTFEFSIAELGCTISGEARRVG